VSGGADSVALLDVLLRGGYTCIVAHCNFHLRGEESDRDELFVRELCANRNVRIITTSFVTKNKAQEIGRSVEMTARILRYEWFDTIARQENCAAIAVAHHQNDQAETLIMNLRRGAGIRGLCGMRPKSNNPCVVHSDIPVIRPLLCTTHDYIKHYLRDIRHIPWVEDSTNTDTSIRRNNIREELSHYQKAEIEHIANTARIMQGYVDWLEHKQTLQAEEAKEYEALRNRG
jgi:tRNA(Ile)-lysidine synthase